MIGNNACGSRALGYGRTADNVAGTAGRVRDRRGRHRRRGRARPVGTALAGLVDAAPRPRAHARSAGSPGRSAATRWSTCCPRTAGGSTASWSAPRAPSALVLEATVAAGRRRAGAPAAWCSATRRWPRPRTPCPPLLGRDRAGWSACEGLDARIVDLVRAAGSAVPDLPRGARLALRRGRRRRLRGACAARVVAAAGALEHRVVADAGRGGRAVADPRGRRRARRPQPDPAGVLRLGGRGRAARAARRLAARLRRAAASSTACDGVPYGHFGDGCVHVRIDFPFDPSRRRGRRCSATS